MLQKKTSMLMLVCSSCYILACWYCKDFCSWTSVKTGFWGGLVPENALNASMLEGLLSAGALGLKVTIEYFEWCHQVLFKWKIVFDPLQVTKKMSGYLYGLVNKFWQSVVGLRVIIFPYFLYYFLFVIPIFREWFDLYLYCHLCAIIHALFAKGLIHIKGWAHRCLGMYLHLKNVFNIVA